jgi:hypothetical protein
MSEPNETSMSDLPECWPALPLEAWKDTYATLHMYTQIVGKVRLALTPLVNHWWNVPLYVTARGLTTTAIPCGKGVFKIQFDFLDHTLRLETNDGLVKTLALVPRSVADFYREFLALLQSAGIRVKIWRMPVEIPNPIPFDEDQVHASYDPEAVRKFWRILVSVDRVFNEFRSRFVGKCSPVSFLLGQLRPRGDSLFRPPGPPTPWRRPYHPRSLLPRSEQRRLLARRRRNQGPSVLFLHGAAAARPLGVTSLAESRLLSPAARRIPSDVRRRAHGPFSQRRAA